METFFLTCSKVDYIKIKELLLRRYHNIEEILKLEVWEFPFFLQEVLTQEQKEKLYNQWCVQAPHFEKQMSFEEFYNLSTGANVDKRPVEALLKEIAEAEKKLEGVV